MLLVDALRGLASRLRAHVRPGAGYREMDDELQYHFDREVERNAARGMPLADARAAARRAMGNEGGVHQEMREATRWAWLARFEADVRFAIRSMRRAPLFAGGVILTIAVALGLNATVFTIFDAYVLRPLAVRDPSTLHRVIVTGRSDEGVWTDSWMDWERYRDLATGDGIVADAIAFRNVYLRIDQVPAIAEAVSGNYFRMLGVGVIRGRPIVPEDATTPGDGAVVVLSHRMWTARFGSDSAVVGRTIEMRGRAFTIIGVVGPSFTGLTEVPVDFWTPATMANVLDGGAVAPGATAWPRAGVLVRLRPGVVSAQAAAAIGARLAAASADIRGTNRVTGARLESRATTITLTPEVLLLIAPIAVAFGLVLAIACANVANMMLARGLARQRELGIRMALGAGRRQVVGQLLAEALVLAVPAAALGYVISRFALNLGVGVMMASFPPAYAAYLRVVPLTTDLRVYAFMLTAAAGAAVLFGLAPALQVTRGNVVAATHGEVDSGVRPGRMRNALVVAQMAGCVLLLIVAGIFLRGSAGVRSLDPGFRADGLVHVELNDAMRGVALSAVRAMPFVRDIAATTAAPARGMYNKTAATVVGRAEVHTVYFTRVSPQYFATLRMPLREGRTFSDVEAASALPVVVLSETAARRLSPGRSALGLEVRLTSDDDALAGYGIKRFRTARVIGVAADAVAGLVITHRDVAIAYYPLSVEAAGDLLVSVGGSVSAATRALESELDRRLPGAVSEASPFDQSVAAQIYPLRAASWVAALLGALALLLTVSGIYGVLAYLVSQRTREIGIRMSLGARPRTVITMVLRQSLRLAAIGGAIGLTLALGVSRLFASAMVVVSTFDAVAYFGSAGVALAACLVAAWVPSWRAATVDPLTALRTD